MPLSEDQKAMLRLLAQREQGYEDLSALMGLSVEEVVAKAEAAVAQLEADGIPAPTLPPAPGASAPTPASAPPLADPAPPAPAEPPAPEPKVDPRPAPPAPEPKAEPRPAPPAPSKPATRPRPVLPEGKGIRAALAAGAAVVVLLVVILIVSGGGDSGDGSDSVAGDSTGAARTAANINPKLTQAVLSAVDGGDAQGVATFGRVKNSLALQIEAEGLEPSGKGQSYTIWLYESPRKMLPLATTAVGASGKIGAQVQVPTEVLAYLAKETFDQIDVSLTEDATLKAALTKATREKAAPIYTGTDVLRGRITGPIVGAADQAGE
jgi:hypothetical protein